MMMMLIELFMRITMVFLIQQLKLLKLPKGLNITRGMNELIYLHQLRLPRLTGYQICKKHGVLVSHGNLQIIES
mgnify:CR=1 FL=1